MRRILTTLMALCGLAWAAPAMAQTPGLSAADAAFYGGVAETAGDDTPPRYDTELPWSQAGRSGTIQFAEPRPNGCFGFFLRELSPERRAPVTGQLCPRPDNASGGADATYNVASGLRNAAAAGPTGEPRSDEIGSTRGGTRGINPPPPSSPRVTAARPVIVMLNRQTARELHNGGNAVVLLGDPTLAGARNRALCDALVQNFDDASMEAVRVGLERLPDGTYARLRPIYWLINESVAAGAGDRCTQRLRRYDYHRAAIIRDKLGLSGAGPWLVVMSGTDRQAAQINMSALNAADIRQMVLYFRNGFSQLNDIWDPQVNTPQRREQGIAAVLGANFKRSLLSAIGVVAAPAARTGACFGDRTDRIACTRAG